MADPSIGSGKMLKDLYAFRIPNPTSLREDLIALYDAEIASDDAVFGGIIAELKRLDLYDSSMVIALSDHGEEFADHGWWEHGKTLYEEQLRVPLIIKFPNGLGAGRRITTTAQHIDVLPTILGQAGITAPTSLPGTNLAAMLHGSSASSAPALSYLNLDGNESESLVQDRWKYIFQHKQAYGERRPKTELFELARDPAEQMNLVDDDPVRAGYLNTILRAATGDERKHIRPEPAVLSESVKEHLRALGYLE